MLQLDECGPHCSLCCPLTAPHYAALSLIEINE